MRGSEIWNCGHFTPRNGERLSWVWKDLFLCVWGCHKASILLLKQSKWEMLNGSPSSQSTSQIATQLKLILHCYYNKILRKLEIMCSEFLYIMGQVFSRMWSKQIFHYHFTLWKRKFSLAFEHVLLFLNHTLLNNFYHYRVLKSPVRSHLKQ